MSGTDNQEKLALLARLIQAEGLASSATDAIPKHNPSELIPASYSQEWVWKRCQQAPNSPFYNSAFALILEGKLNRASLEESLREIVRRHAAWRTAFSLIDGTLCQQINPEPVFELNYYDLSVVNEAEQYIETEKLAVHQAHKLFDLNCVPLIRAALLKHTDTRHVLALVVHHIIADGWSTGLFIKELAVLYPAFSNGNSSPLPELPIQYPDYTLWQRNWLQGELDKQLAYWSNQLFGLPEVQPSLAGEARPNNPDYAGKSYSLELSEDLSSALKRLSQQEGVTLFTLLLSAFAALINLYSGQEDIALGTPVANRSTVEAEALLGCFVNNLVIRADFSGNSSFKQILSLMNKVCLEAFAHQDMPFVKLVEALKPGNNASHPFFQTRFEFSNFPSRERLEIKGLRLSPLEFETGLVRFDLNLIMEERDNRLVGWLQYATALYSDAFIIRLAQNYENLLQHIVRQPELRLNELSLDLLRD
ncbi:MAG: hypothetical protein HXX08_06890 [Chloroflexi bacterium]|uniref:Condensation domain-containing protein n=1 Tax=Candidatus Chlorohelix allophototropha TaxID=3003348 RepID=A0A8T7LXI6_9CHLR|nr:hypothetical protein [Chloroflexota bacterium]WJW67460.1 condensation domain-containing protein [Chloroflexota bacterium L227-S17]